MANKSLGKGLSSLIPKKGEPAGAVDQSRPTDPNILIQRYINKEIKLVPPAVIKANPHQPRRHFAEAEIRDLVESIKEHGILQPLVVTEAGEGRFELVAGERRLRASKQAKLKNVPVIVRSAGELEKLELSLIENIQRQDLNAIERATAYRKLIDEFSLTHEKAAKRLGKSRPVISNALRLLDLPGQVQELISAGRVSESHALAILELEDTKEQIELAKRVAQEHLSKDEVRQEVKARRRSERSGGQARQGNSAAAAWEQALSSVLKTRVKVSRRSQGGWKIEIETYSDEEAGSIVKRIVKN